MSINQVYLEDSELFNLQSLACSEALRDPLYTGDKVRVFGCKTPAGSKLNDTMGECAGDEVDGRFPIALAAGGPTKLLKRANLLRIASLGTQRGPRCVRITTRDTQEAKSLIVLRVN